MPDLCVALFMLAVKCKLCWQKQKTGPRCDVRWRVEWAIPENTARQASTVYLEQFHPIHASTPRKGTEADRLKGAAASQAGWRRCFPPAAMAHTVAQRRSAVVILILQLIPHVSASSQSPCSAAIEERASIQPGVQGAGALIARS